MATRRPQPTITRRHPRAKLALLALALASGCASYPLAPPSANVLMADAEGRPVDPKNGRTVLEAKEYEAYVSNIFESIKEYCTGQKKCKVLIFFHGGLNSRATSVRRASELTDRIKRDGTYPIFVSWNSGFASTYKDHLLWVHKGLRERHLAWAAPVILAQDEIGSIAQAGTAWYAEIRHAFPRLIERRAQSWRTALCSYQTLLGTKSDDRIDLNDLPREQAAYRAGVCPNQAGVHDLLDQRTRSERLRSHLAYLPTLPTKLLAPPLIIQAFGTGAWDVMRRRTATLFRTESDFSSSAPLATDNGAMLARFISLYQKFADNFCGKRGFEKEQKNIPKQETPNREESAAGCPALELTLVGHSMGTIIIDQLLRYAPNIQISNLVYMAGATTVSDYRDTVLPYLEAEAGDNRRTKTQVYHLVLHPTAEITERGTLDLAPRGSLLVWIDNYFTNPATPLDRTVGRFYNLMPELSETPSHLRNQIHAKIFRVGQQFAATDPQVHGDFSLFPFWDEAFWKPTVPSSRIERILIP